MTECNLTGTSYAFKKQKSDTQLQFKTTWLNNNTCEKKDFGIIIDCKLNMDSRVIQKTNAIVGASAEV